MKTKINLLCIIFLICISYTLTLTAQEAGSQIIKGQVSEIAEDGSYIMVNGIKIITDSDFLKDYLLESGDQVEITVDQDENDLIATELSYILDEEKDEEKTDISLED